jgi:hypothetical protein
VVALALAMVVTIGIGAAFNVAAASAVAVVAGGRWVRVRDPSHAVLIQAAARQQALGFRCGLGLVAQRDLAAPAFPGARRSGWR